MRVALMGPELEENLGLRYLHASLAAAGHEATILDFHEREQIPQVVRAVLDAGPGLVGLSMIFTGRARQYVDLAMALRQAGYRGHVTAGGHFASFHAARLLGECVAIDSVVHGDAEQAIVDLAQHLDDLSPVDGVSYRDGSGAVRRNKPRRNPDDLDSLAPPTRPARLHSYLGLPIANMLSSRGCFGRCSYCSISAWYRQNGGRRLRQRSSASVAGEMASLHHERGVRIFNFHDDNFFLPDARRNIERFEAIRERLDHEGVGRIALQIKARPDSVDVETFSLLGRMGLFRVFLGIETDSPAGLRTLGRRTCREQGHEAIRILRELDIHTSFNLLVFDPETTPEDLADNIAFMRRYASMPFNFGRVEVYSGTPLERWLRVRGRLLGDWFGHTYRIRDGRMQDAFEMYKRVFLPRNFDVRGLSLRTMKLDYFLHLLAHFHPERVSSSLRRRVARAITDVNLSSADLLSRILDAVSGAGDRERVAARLAAERERFDEARSPRMDALLDEIQDLGAGRPSGLRIFLPGAASAAAVLLITVVSCKPAHETPRPLPPPPEKPVVEAPAAEPVPGAEPVHEELTQEQIDALKEVIADRYQEAVNALVTEYGMKDKKIGLDLVLDGSGAVKDVEVEVPTDVRIVSFESELEQMVLGWVFEGYGHQVHCTVTIEYVEPPPPPSHHRPKKDKDGPPDWHMCEMMMEPME